MILLIAHDTLEQAQDSAKTLKELGHHALKLMAECVEFTGVKRKQLSSAAKLLEDAGFVIVYERGDGSDSQYELMPTLEGEEALELLDESEFECVSQ